MTEEPIYACELLKHFAVIGKSHNDAIMLILDGLVGGRLHAIGTPDWPETSRLTRRHRTDRELIPQAFWRDATLGERAKWSWLSNCFSAYDPNVPLSSEPPAYRDVAFYAGSFFNELDVQTLSSEREALSDKPKSNAGRKRQSGWNDWIAYLVIAANDIDRAEGPDALMAKVASLMAEDGLPEMPRTTVQPAATAIIALMNKKRI